MLQEVVSGIINSISGSDREDEEIAALCNLTKVGLRIREDTVRTLKDDTQMQACLKRTQLLFIDNCLKLNRENWPTGVDCFEYEWLKYIRNRLFDRLTDPIGDFFGGVAPYSGLILKADAAVTMHKHTGDDERVFMDPPDDVFMQSALPLWQVSNKYYIPDIHHICDIFNYIWSLNMDDKDRAALWTRLVLTHTPSNVQNIAAMLYFIKSQFRVFTNKDLNVTLECSDFVDMYYDDALKTGDFTKTAEILSRYYV